MFKTKLILLVALSMVFFVRCSDEQIAPELGVLNSGTPDLGVLKSGKADKATGSLELEWKGGKKGSDQGNQPEDLLTYIEFNAKGATTNNGPKGEVVYSVKNPDMTLHREIKADVVGVEVNDDTNKAWIVALIVSDSKVCNDVDLEEHESGCSDADNGEGGCSDDNGSSHDGGCSHDEGDTSDDGCSHDEGDTGDDGCSHDESGTENGHQLSGKNCRLGQLIAIKIHDGGTPGTNGDGITWKWFDADASWVPSIKNIEDWPHLCKKTIIGGNLVVHK